jgi:hypothetical protein
MPTGWRIELFPVTNGMIVRGDPVGIYTDPEGETFLVSATPTVIEGEKTSVTEGPLQEPAWRFADGS